jgi:pyruvate-ferredoxin/flavodoxin oxidoreductase
LIAYSTCIAHGIDMTESMSHQKDAAKSAYWPLYRYDPASRELHLDSKKPTLPFKSFAMKEARFAMLAMSDAERADHLLDLAQKDIDRRWQHYEQIAAASKHAEGK